MAERFTRCSRTLPEVTAVAPGSPTRAAERRLTAKLSPIFDSLRLSEWGGAPTECSPEQSETIPVRVDLEMRASAVSGAVVKAVGVASAIYNGRRPQAAAAPTFNFVSTDIARASISSYVPQDAPQTAAQMPGVDACVWLAGNE